MNAFLEQILDRPPSQKLIILAVLALLLIAAFYSLAYAPKAAEIASLAQELEAARSDKAVKQQRAANLPRLRKELRDLDMRLKEIVAQLPDKREIPDLLTNISTKAQEAGLDILLFRPRPENPKDFYAEVPVDINVKGTFQSVVAFFDEVGHMHRLVNIDNIGFKNPTVAGDRVVLETASVATAFRFLDEAERKRIAEEKAKAAKEQKK
ncbi:MAG TPA: type 4a pilus biogenesis protein PilO [candidate division Zixibacteria bacterium]|nr:type 4a pilus biogenesis protein PilO [candidate division Zixibacteria bacterium]